MNRADNNPHGNALSPGVTDEHIANAIRKSGYPLQLAVASELAKQFYLEEEWAFQDSDATRTIDILANKRLFEWRSEWNEGSQPRTRPTLSLAIECKQSDLPYVFFLSDNRPWLKDFPIITGVKSDHITISTDDDRATWNLRIFDVLGLQKHAFLEAPAVCMTLSKCVRKGSELMLSGSDAYQGLVFPLIKAALHHRDRQAPPKTAIYFDCNLTIPVAVIDAPMVGVRLKDGAQTQELLPWVRVAKHQPLNGDHQFDRGTIFGIDVVHKDFLPDYIDAFLMPFAKEFGQLALKHHTILAEAKAFVAGMRAKGSGNIEPRLEVRGPGSSKRAR